MEREIVWSNFAKSKLRNLHDYYSLKVSLSTAERLIEGIIDSTKKLIKYPQSGQLESYEIDLPYEIRSVKFKKYKIIYIFRNYRIEVLNLFDMRQDPNRIIEEIKDIKKGMN